MLYDCMSTTKINQPRSNGFDKDNIEQKNKKNKQKKRVKMEKQKKTIYTAIFTNTKAVPRYFSARAHTFCRHTNKYIYTYKMFFEKSIKYEKNLCCALERHRIECLCFNSVVSWCAQKTLTPRCDSHVVQLR